MKVDHEYLKKILITFESSPQPDTNIKEMINAGFDPKSADFIFHMRLIGDNELVTRTDGREGRSFYVNGYLGTAILPIEVPLRLTAKGHDFIADLRQKEVWNVVKTNFKDASISGLVDIAKQLAQGFTKQKIKSITGLDID